MRDLRQLTDAVPADALGEMPSLGWMEERAGTLRRRHRQRRAITLLAALVLVLSVRVTMSEETDAGRVRLVERGSSSPTSVAPGDSAPGAEQGTSEGSPTTTSPPQAGNAPSPRSVPGPAAAPAPPRCEPEANTASDVGVTKNRIRLAATNVRSGMSSVFLGTAYIGMQAVVHRVNEAGGICGRLLDLRLVDDGGDAERGAHYLRHFATEDYFALPVVPSPEGLALAIDRNVISDAAIPVVGSDGTHNEQFHDSWVWAVGQPIVTTMRVMAEHAHDTGARSFGIVYDNQRRFGIQGAKAFRQYVQQLPGVSLKADVGLTPGKGSYAGEANDFNDACGGAGCEFVAMLLTPETAATYISSQSESGGKKRGFGTKLTGGPPALFSERFARDCARHCDGMYMWTGYNPPIGDFAADPDVARYVDDVQSVDPGVDVSNTYLESAYVGMEVLVRALRHVGSDLTRERLRDAFDTLTFRSGFTADLRWGPAGTAQRVANASARAFRIETASGSFVGLRDAGTGWIRDPQPGHFPD